MGPRVGTRNRTQRWARLNIEELGQTAAVVFASIQGNPFWVTPILDPQPHGGLSVRQSAKGILKKRKNKWEKKGKKHQQQPEFKDALRLVWRWGSEWHRSHSPKLPTIGTPHRPSLQLAAQPLPFRLSRPGLQQKARRSAASLERH